MNQPQRNPVPQPMNDFITSSDIEAIIVNGDPKLLVEKADAIGRALSRNLTKRQIRNIFGAVKQIQMFWQGDEQRTAAYRRLLMLKPRLQYQAGRMPSVKPLAEVLNEAIDFVEDDRERFLRFVDFFEAILSYHTAYGGKD